MMRLRVPSRAVTLLGDTATFRGNEALWRIFGGLLTLYGLSLAALLSVGAVPNFPWKFLTLLVLVAVPIAYGVTHGIFFLEGRFGAGSRLVPAIFVIVGLLLAWSYQLRNPLVHLAGWAMLVFVLWRLAREQSELLRPLAVSIPILTFGYGSIWNLNYLAAKFSAARVHDPAVRDIDLAVYGWLFGRLVKYEGLFPIVTSRFVFELLENAYLILFVEIFVVVFVLIQRKAALAPFFRTVFACYLAGLGIFFLLPVVGPCIYYPESFRGAYQGTLTHEVMRGMAAEYAALKDGSPLNGFGYFVGIPSLHVAMAVLLQSFLYQSRSHFWAFLPINLLLSVGTFLLGYHYVIDAPAGALLALIVLSFGWHRSRRANSGNVMGESFA